MASQRSPFNSTADQFSASFSEQLHKLFQGRYTRIGTQGPEVDRAFCAYVSQHLDSILCLVQGEARYALDAELGWPEQWTTVPLRYKLQRVAALLTSRIFVGEPLSRDNEWLKTCINFTQAAECVMNATQKVNRVFRPFVVPFMPEVAQAVQSLKKGESCLKPVVADIMARTKEDSISDGERPNPRPGDKGAFMSWMLDYLPAKERCIADRIATDQLLVCFIRIYNTTRILEQTIWDLASSPAKAQMLRAEIDELIAEKGLELDEDGSAYFPETSIMRLTKLHRLVSDSQGYYSDDATSRSTLTTYELMIVLIELLLNYEMRLQAEEDLHEPRIKQTKIGKAHECNPVIMFAIRRRGSSEEKGV